MGMGIEKKRRVRQYRGKSYCIHSYIGNEQRKKIHGLHWDLTIGFRIMKKKFEHKFAE